MAYTDAMLSVGDSAPDFALPDQDGAIHALKDYRRQWVLIYFYPKDDTPGCTREACQLRDTFPSFEEMNAKVFGVSADTVASHKKFATKYHLPFTLLADPEKGMITSYGVWQQKSMMGHKYMGIARSSFLISPDGKVAKIYEKVKPEIHADEVLADLKTLGA